MRHQRVVKKFGRSKEHRDMMMRNMVTNLILAETIKTTLPKAKEARKLAEKLVLDVWTDGRVTPDDALKTAAAVLRRHLDVFVDYAEEEILEFEDSDSKGSDERERLRKLLNMSVNEIELSVRAANCLNNASIATVGELVSKTEADMLKYRNFGKKSLTEIKDKLKELGLCLGYKFDADLLESKK